MAHNQNSALGHQNSKKQLSKQRMDYIATCKIMLIITAQNQRTNGPVNAHLRPEIYTNKLV